MTDNLRGKKKRDSECSGKFRRRGRKAHLRVGVREGGAFDYFAKKKEKPFRSFCSSRRTKEGGSPQHPKGRKAACSTCFEGEKHGRSHIRGAGTGKNSLPRRGEEKKKRTSPSAREEGRTDGIYLSRKHMKLVIHRRRGKGKEKKRSNPPAALGGRRGDISPALDNGAEVEFYDRGGAKGALIAARRKREGRGGCSGHFRKTLQKDIPTWEGSAKIFPKGRIRNLSFAGHEAADKVELVTGVKKIGRNFRQLVNGQERKSRDIPPDKPPSTPQIMRGGPAGIVRRKRGRAVARGNRSRVR